MNGSGHTARWEHGTWVLGALAVVLALIVYYPITGNYFFGDDLLNLYRIVNFGFVEYVLRPYAGHILVVRNAIFYLCFELFGTQVRYYFYLVLLTHLVNVFLVFQVIRTFTRSAYLACFGAVLWGVSPINEGTLGWYSVYGQVLVGTAVAWFLYELARVAGGRPASRWLGARLVVLLIVTSTMFGTGIGVAMTAPFAAFVLLPPTPARRRLVFILSSLVVIVPVLYSGLHHFAGMRVDGAGPRLPAKMLVMWDTISSLCLHLVGNGLASLLMGVLHDAFPYPSWPAVLAVVAYAAALAATLVRGPAPAKRQVAACLLLVAGSYALVGLGRGIMVGPGLKPEMLYRAARYHYFGPMLMAIALCTMLGCVRGLRSLQPAQKATLLALSLVLVGGSRIVFGESIDHHDMARRRTLSAVSRFYRQIRQAPGPDVYIPYPKQPFRGVGPMLLRKPLAFPGWAAVFIIFFPENVVDGKRVWFAVNDPYIIFATARGRRTKDLFIMERNVPE